MFSGENKDMFPPVGTEANCDSPSALGWVAAPDGPTIYPEYCTDMNIYFCPSDSTGEPKDFLECPNGEWCQQAANAAPDCVNQGKLDAKEFDDRSYMYYGYLQENEAVFTTRYFEIFCEAYGGGVPLPAPYNTAFTTDAEFQSSARNDISIRSLTTLQTIVNLYWTPLGLPGTAPTLKGNAGGTKILRLKEGIERFLITDINNTAGSAKAQSTSPVMWDQVNRNVKDFFHVPGGANVLYMDGHVEFKRYNAGRPNDMGYPVCEGVAILGRAID